MSRPRFLADNDLNDHIVTGLLRREPAIELVRAREAGLDHLPDPELLEYAATAGLIVVSHDMNTMRGFAYARVAQRRPMAGLLLVHQDSSIKRTIDDLLLIWAASEADEWHGRVVFLPI